MFFYAFEGTVLHFGKYSYLLPCQEFDEKINKHSSKHVNIFSSDQLKYASFFYLLGKSVNYIQCVNTSVIYVVKI